VHLNGSPTSLINDFARVYGERAEAEAELEIDGQKNKAGCLY